MNRAPQKLIASISRPIVLVIAGLLWTATFGAAGESPDGNGTMNGFDRFRLQFSPQLKEGTDGKRQSSPVREAPIVTGYDEERQPGNTPVRTATPALKDSYDQARTNSLVTITMQEGNIVVTWPEGMSLEYTTAIGQPWQPLTAGGNHIVINPENPGLSPTSFFRAIK